MNTTIPKVRHVSLWARALAGVVATVGIVALAGTVFVVVQGRDPSPPITLLIGLGASTPMIALFGYVATRGTVPRWRWLTSGWSGP
jgi:hypothetical protein